MDDEREAHNQEAWELLTEVPSSSGVLVSTRRLEPSRGRGRPCSPSREELAHREEQPRKRECDEHNLVDVVFAGRQSAYEVRCPENRVVL